MVLECPELDKQLFSIVPAEERLPLNFLVDKEMSFPYIFCNGVGGFHTEHEVKLTWS